MILDELFEKIFVISLPGSSRRERVHKHFKRLGIKNWEFFDALDGGQLPLQQLELDGVICRTRNWHYQMMPGEFGCALSHYHLWRHQEARAYHSILVCEDDIRFVEDVDAEVRKRWRHIRDDWGVVHFHTHHPGLTDHGRVRRRISEGVYSGDSEWGGTVCYALKDVAAAWLQTEAMPITWAVDGIVASLSSRSYNQQAGRSYILLPCLAGHDGSESEIDRIDGRHRPAEPPPSELVAPYNSGREPMNRRVPVPSYVLYLKSTLPTNNEGNSSYIELPLLSYRKQLSDLARAIAMQEAPLRVPPQQRRIICTSAFGEQESLLGLTIDSALRYAVACDADYLVMKEPSEKLLGNMRKFAVIEAAILQGYDEIAYIDIDTWISPSAPNLFETLAASGKMMAIRPECGGEWYLNHELPLMRDFIMPNYTGDLYSNTGVVVASASVWEQVLEQSYVLYHRYPGDWSDQLYFNPALEMLEVDIHSLPWYMNAWIPTDETGRERYCSEAELGILHANGRNLSDKFIHLEHVKKLVPLTE